ncbi:Na+/H+ antiporter NhaA [Vibrio chagasii]|nr:Na+/H+ antiporter NhaA [Vibrio chagasii]
MSIFISSLAFGPMNADFDTLARLGILMGSTTAAILGYSAKHFFTEKLSTKK